MSGGAFPEVKEDRHEKNSKQSSIFRISGIGYNFHTLVNLLSFGLAENSDIIKRLIIERLILRLGGLWAA